jgi:hypothetical protein
MTLSGLARVGFLIDRHEIHQPHKAADALFFYQAPFIAQVSSHLTTVIERRLKELLITPHRNCVSTAGQRITRIRSMFISHSPLGS